MSNFDLKSIGERIKKLREKTGLTQEGFAEKMLTTRQTVAKWETGRQDFKTQEIIRMADIFHVSCDYLLGCSESKSNDKELTDVSDYLGISDEATDTICKCSGKFHTGEACYLVSANYKPMNNGNITDWCIRNLLFEITYTLRKLIANFDDNKINSEDNNIGEKAYIDINRLADFIKNRIDELMINYDKESGSNSYKTIYDIQNSKDFYFLFNFIDSDNSEQD